MQIIIIMAMVINHSIKFREYFQVKFTSSIKYCALILARYI